MAWMDIPAHFLLSFHYTLSRMYTYSVLINNIADNDQLSILRAEIHHGYSADFHVSAEWHGALF